MYTELQFNTLVEAATGKKLGVDYGFIMGLHTPYTQPSFNSSANKTGFRVWRKEGNKNMQMDVVYKDQNLMMDEIIKFLNLKLDLESRPGEVVILGEYSDIEELNKTE